MLGLFPCSQCRTGTRLAPDVAQLGAHVRSSGLLKSFFFLEKSKAGAKQVLCAPSRNIPAWRNPWGVELQG